jgi:amidophosphoribosyltransferase
MCGIFGIFGHQNGKEITKTGIWSQQHRGQDAAGFACLKMQCSKESLIEVHKERGKVKEVFRGPDFDEMQGDAFIAHIRYPTQGKPSKRNVQPHYTQSTYGRIVIVSNGDVVNMEEQRNFLDRYKIRIYTDNDAELIAASINYQVAVRKRDLVEAIFQVMDHIKGAFSALVMCEFDDRIFAFRDPYGIRPLFLACVNEDGKDYFMFASETAAFDSVMPLFGPKARLINVRPLEPAEIVAVGRDGVEKFSDKNRAAPRQAFCLFEFVYFSRPDSQIFGRSFQEYRISAGQEMFCEHSIAADIVSPIPKSGIPAGVGYSLASSIPYIPVIIENPTFEIDYGQLRTFIESTEEERLFAVELKFNYIRELIKGKRIINFDDSKVRGLVSRVVNTALRQCGAKAIYTCFASPPYHFPCYYGIETKERTKLAAFMHQTREKERQYIGWPDDFFHLSLDGLIKSTGLKKDELCTACFDGNYPIAIPKK